MAHTVNVTKILEGPRDVIFHVYIKSDGMSTDLRDYVIVDPTVSINPTKPALPTFKIIETWSSLYNFEILFEFNGVTDTPVMVLVPTQGESHFDFDCFGGLKDRTNPMSGTGQLQITTDGLQADVTAEGFFIIKLRKE